MGYQALLFCPDEKLAGVVSQVFSEVDFTVETVLEPFGAVKKLMKQRYDALVVNSDNEQNASLLFRSARNSSFNQSSLAIALVEGQAGVAKAYRIGANLVLTKPINVEQAKGTLRVARGLLRKNADAAGAGAAANPAVPAKPAPISAANSFTAQHRPGLGSMPAMATPANAFDLPADVVEDAPEFRGAPQAMIEEPAFGGTTPGELRIHETTPDETTPDEPMAGFPSTAVPAKTENKPTVAPATAVRAEISAVGAAPTEGRQPAPGALQNAPEKDVGKKNAVSSATAAVAAATKPAQNMNPPAMGSAAAPAPAKEAAAPAKNKAMESRPAAAAHHQATEAISAPTFGSMSASDAPSFAALGGEDSGGSAGAKKGLIVAGIILGLAALGYIGYGMLGNSSRTAPVRAPANTPRNSDNPPATVRPMSAPVEPAQTAPDRASIESPMKNPTSAARTATAISVNEAPTNSAASASTMQEIRIGGSSAPATQKPEAAPLLVKSNPAPPKTPARADDSSTPPSPPVVASADDSAVSGLVSSAATTLPKPALGTLKVSQGVTQGLLIKRVTPQYPSSALAVHAQGAVEIEATINKDGNVINPKVLSGNPLLAQAALEAVRQWRYKPYTLDGVPVEIQTQITVNFKTN